MLVQKGLGNEERGRGSRHCIAIHRTHVDCVGTELVRMETATFSRTSGCVRTSVVSRRAAAAPVPRQAKMAAAATPFARGSAKLCTAAPRQAGVQGARAASVRVQARGGRRGEPDDGLEERVVQISRVVKVVKGGNQLRFRAVVIVGDGNGRVGVGCSKAKEVAVAVQKASLDAKKNLVEVPITKALSIPHGTDIREGAARLMLRPAAEGTGVIAGGAVRIVLELAGVQNVFGKQLGSQNPLNNARATVKALSEMRTFRQVAQERGLTIEEMFAFQPKAST